MVFADAHTKDWLCGCGDQISHAILSSLLHCQEKYSSTKLDAKARQTLFVLYMQAALAELSLALLRRGRTQHEAHALVSTLSTTLLDRPATALVAYNQLLTLPASQRPGCVGRTANPLAGCSGGLIGKHLVTTAVMLAALTEAMAEKLADR